MGEWENGRMGEGASNQKLSASVASAKEARNNIQKKELNDYTI
jgi:hypothetical protein